jgi:hypothetical protein
MVYVSAELRKYYEGRLLFAPEVALERFKDNGETIFRFMESLLERWKESNIKFEGELILARKSQGSKAFTVTRKKWEDVEPWQVCDQPEVVSNLDLICALHSNRNLDNHRLVERALEKVFRKSGIGESTFWAAALCRYSNGASFNAMTECYVNFADALYGEGLTTKKNFGEQLETLRRETQKHRDAQRKFIRAADKTKARKLRTAIDAYRKKNPSRSRHDAATVLSRDASIGLGITRIKEYFNEWFSLEVWPKTTAGRRPKGRE